MEENLKEWLDKVFCLLQRFFYLSVEEDIVRNRRELKVALAMAEREGLLVTKDQLTEALVDRFWVPGEPYAKVMRLKKKGEGELNVVVRGLGTVKMTFWLKGCTKEIALATADSFVTHVLDENYMPEPLREAAMMFADCGRTNLEVTCEYNNEKKQPKRIQISDITFEDIRTPEKLQQVLDAVLEETVENLKEYKGTCEAGDNFRRRMKELGIHTTARIECTGFVSCNCN